MKKRSIASLVVAAAWALLVLSGFGVIQSVQGQHAVGYPDVLQMGYYVGIPIVGVVLALLGAILGQRLKTESTIALPLLCLVALPIFILSYTGGL